MGQHQVDGLGGGWGFEDVENKHVPGIFPGGALQGQQHLNGERGGGGVEGKDADGLAAGVAATDLARRKAGDVTQGFDGLTDFVQGFLIELFRGVDRPGHGHEGHARQPCDIFD